MPKNKATIDESSVKFSQIYKDEFIIKQDKGLFCNVCNPMVEKKEVFCRKSSKDKKLLRSLREQKEVKSKNKHF
jgi:hypothetical protein